MGYPFKFQQTFRSNQLTGITNCKNLIIATQNVLHFTHHRLQAICYQETALPRYRNNLDHHSKIDDDASMMNEHIRNLISRFLLMLIISR